MKREKRVRKKKLKGYAMPIYVAVAAIIFLATLSSLIQIPVTGDTAFIDTPIVAPLDLDLLGEYLVDVSVNEIWPISFTSSNNEKFLMKIQVQDGDKLKYTLTLENLVIAVGLLDSSVPSSGEIYVDQDLATDVEFRYDNGHFLVKNLNYVSPSLSQFTLLDENMVEITDEVLAVKVGDDHTFFLNVTATSLPQISILFEGEEIVAGVEEVEEEIIPTSTTTPRTPRPPTLVIPDVVIVTDNPNVVVVPIEVQEEEVVVEEVVVQEPLFNIEEIEVGENYKILQVTWMPKEDKLYKFVVTSNVGGQVSEKEYLFAGNGKVLDNPEMRLNPGTNDVVVELVFKRSNELQPFSLPCMGRVRLNEFTRRRDVARIYGFDQEVRQWERGAVSDLREITSGKGYVLKLTDPLTPLNLTVECSLQNVILPELLTGWNLIGIPTFKEVLPSELSLPPTRRIKEVLHVVEGGAHELASILKPGEAYWVFVE
jgi:hypothetical protein